MYRYKTKGTCSSAIDIDVRGDEIQSVTFHNGCSGNLQGLSKLVAGMKVDEAIARLGGIRCQGDTSCPDQLAKALTEMKKREAT